MKACNYIPFETPNLDPSHPFFEDILDMDILRTDEGIFINVSTQQ